MSFLDPILVSLTLTLITYIASQWLYQRTGHFPLLHPVLVSILLIIGFLKLANISYQDYFKGGQYIHFLLGIAVVSLAVPLYKQFSTLKKVWLPASITLVGGVSFTAFITLFLTKLLGLSELTQLSMVPKSVTTPVAMAISEEIGGHASLTAVLVISTGILGAVIGVKLMALLGIKDNVAKGLAMGITSHGIGTARAFQENNEMGTFSGLATALSTFVAAIVIPWLVYLFGF